MVTEREIAERRLLVLYDRKWKKFLKRSFLWRHLPFVEFALGAGSLAIGNVHGNSDFDVIVGAKTGRIFTARFFAVLAFGALGWRRKKTMSHREAASDKVCLNHFVTEPSFRLQPPYNAYWQTLYRRLIPIYGTPPAVQKFFDANSGWAGEKILYREDLRYLGREPSPLKRALEGLLGGRAGDGLEFFLRRVQIRLIERSIKDTVGHYQPRLRYDDDELEFHPDTRRIEEYCKKENQRESLNPNI